MVENSTSFDLHLFEKSAHNVCQSFNIFHQILYEYMDTSIENVTDDILFEENVSTVEESVELEQISTTLTELNVMQLSDKTIVQNFSNQDGKLVCLVCYQIFTSNLDLSSFRQHLSTHSLSIRRWGHLFSEVEESNSSPLEQESSSKAKSLKKTKSPAKTFKGIFQHSCDQT